MKTLILTICMGVISSPFLVAQEAEKLESKPESKPEQSELESAEELKTLSPKGLLISFEKSGLTYDQATPVDSTIPSAGLKKDIPLVIVTNKLTTINLQRIQVTGTATPAIKKRTFGSFLQLFNPFAPTEYGGTRDTGSRQAVSRAFHDPVTDGPSTVIIGIGNRPNQADD